jgi:hypothetical protein
MLSRQADDADVDDPFELTRRVLNREPTEAEVIESWSSPAIGGVGLVALRI